MDTDVSFQARGLHAIQPQVHKSLSYTAELCMYRGARMQSQHITCDIPACGWARSNSSVLPYSCLAALQLVAKTSQALFPENHHRKSLTWPYRCYAADISRTFPASGKFTALQKDLYNGVLKVQVALLARRHLCRCALFCCTALLLAICCHCSLTGGPIRQ